jgi:hypothetical protein
MVMVAGFQGPELGRTDAQPLGQLFDFNAVQAPCGSKCASKLLQFRDRFCQGDSPFAGRGRLLGIRNVAQGSHSIIMI